MNIFLHFLLFATLLGVTLAFPKKLPSSKYSPSSKTAAVRGQGTSDDKEDYDEYYEEEKRPYSFAWKASRYYNGAPDREHIEERDEDGITRGVFRYIDPLQRIQEVVYVSDDDGFRVEASNLPQDTPVVSAAKQRHFKLFEKIRKEHERIGKELAETEEGEKD